MPLENLQEKELLNLLSTGNERAFKCIYDQYRNRIYSYAFLLTESEDKAEEVVQEVFLKLWVNRSKLQSVANFNAWMHTITRNHFFDVLKKMATEAAALKAMFLLMEQNINNTNDFILSRENESLLQKFVEKLPPQQKLVFQLRNQGFKLKEISTKLNISPNTVKVHLGRALHTLKDQLKNHTDTAMISAAILFSKDFLK